MQEPTYTLWDGDAPMLEGATAAQMLAFVQQGQDLPATCTLD